MANSVWRAQDRQRAASPPPTGVRDRRPVAALSAKDAVIVAIHPHSRRMIDGMDSKCVLAADAHALTAAACITVHAALGDRLKFAPAMRSMRSWSKMLPDSYEPSAQLRRTAPTVGYALPALGLGSLSQFDPSLVPSGHRPFCTVGLCTLPAASNGRGLG